MPTRRSSIGADLVIDPRKAKKALTDFQADATRFAASLETIKAPRTGALSGEGMGGLKQSLTGVIGKYQHLRQAVTDVAGAAVRVAGAPAMYADMRDALTAVTGSADEAGEALNFLAAVSRDQALEFEPLVEAYEHMRALGYSAEQTRDFIREMGNAIETAGGDAADLTAVAGALAKMQDNGELTAKALHSMGESMPFLRTIMKQQFGAETAADIESLGLSMQELFDGIMRGLHRVETNKAGALDRMSPEYIASQRRLEAARALGGEGMNANAIRIADLPDRRVDPADPSGDAARIAQFRAREAERKAAAAAAKKAATEAEGLAAQEEATALTNKQLQLEQARADGNAERIAQLEQELRMMTEGKDIMEKTGLAAEVVADHLQRRADNEAEIERLRSQAGQGDFAAGARDDMEVARLRSRGKNKQADKLAADRAEQARVKQLMEQGGLSESEATKMAAGERQITEDQAYLDRTGRRKMHGAISDNTFGGIDSMRTSDRLMGMSDEWNFDRLDAAKSDRRNRPLKSDRDRANGQPAIKPDATSGMTQKQADEMLEVLKAIRTSTERNAPTVADQTKPRSS